MHIFRVNQHVDDADNPWTVQTPHIAGVTGATHPATWGSVTLPGPTPMEQKRVLFWQSAQGSQRLAVHIRAPQDLLTEQVSAPRNLICQGQSIPKLHQGRE